MKDLVLGLITPENCTRTPKCANVLPYRVYFFAVGIREVVGLRI